MAAIAGLLGGQLDDGIPVFSLKSRLKAREPEALVRLTNDLNGILLAMLNRPNTELVDGAKETLLREAGRSAPTCPEGRPMCFVVVPQQPPIMLTPRSQVQTCVACP